MSNPKYFYTLGPIYSSESTLRMIYSLKTSPKTYMKFSLLKWIHLMATYLLKMEAL